MREVLVLWFTFCVLSCDGADEPPRPPEPVPVVLAEPPPPPITGGSLIIARDGRTAIAADADRDRIFIVDLELGALAREVILEPGDDPGRVAEDEQRRAHVLLRATGEVASVDIDVGEVVARRPACAAPRGLAFQAGFTGASGPVDVVHVACAAGELVTLPVDGGGPIRSLKVDDDLRDVIIDGPRTLLTRFRTAELLVVDDAGAPVERLAPSTFVTSGRFEPAVAWRAVQLAEGRIAVLHQRAKTTIDLKAGTYTAGSCSGAVVHGTISVFGPLEEMGGTQAPSVGAYLDSAVLPVDFAVSPDGYRFAIVSAGTDELLRLPVSGFEQGDGCGSLLYAEPSGLREKLPGQPIGVAYDGQGRIIVQLREPAALLTLSPLASSVPSTTLPIELSTVSRKDTGHDLFHRVPKGSAGIACASCHVEGGDDGRVREFSGMGMRRTQNLRGNIAETAPFHWDGKLADMPALIDDTLHFRMGGDPISQPETAALERWIASIPLVAVPAPTDAAAVARGEALFHDAALGCNECHNGKKFTSNETKDVGRGAFQVPSLVGLSTRAPYLHDGCATTIYERFDSECGGGQHGHTSQLTEEQLDDLVAYLLSL